MGDIIFLALVGFPRVGGQRRRIDIAGQIPTARRLRQQFVGARVVVRGPDEIQS